MKRREALSNTQLLMSIAIGIFIVMYAAAMIGLGGGFLRFQQIFDLLNDNAYLIIIACALTVVMIGGGINISVGGVIGLTVMDCAIFLNSTSIQSSFLGILVTLLLALGIGLAFGIGQGFLVSYLDIQPFIVTLAGMFLSRGLTTILSVDPVKVAHEGFLGLSKTKIQIPFLGYVAQNGNPIPAKLEIGAVVAIAVVILCFLMLRYMKLGRNIYALGGNQTSALMLGINVKRTRFLSYVISGLLSGLAGFVFLMHKPAGNASVAMRSEMDAIAASIIGGTLLTGGVGNVIGSFFGVMILATIQKIIALSPLNESWWQDMASGALLGFFIMLQSVVLSSRDKRRARKSAEESAAGKGTLPPSGNGGKEAPVQVPENAAEKQSLQPAADGEDDIDLNMTDADRKKLADAIHKTAIATGRDMSAVESAVLSGNKVPKKLLAVCQASLEMNLVQSAMTGGAPSPDQAELHTKLTELLGKKE